MAGTLVVSKGQNRIETISGKLTQDVTIGWGLLGRLREGGTFRVERREVAPGLWQIVETHVHIEGKALFFKTIGEQQDEVQTEFTQVPGRNDAGTGCGNVEAFEWGGERGDEVTVLPDGPTARGAATSWRVYPVLRRRAVAVLPLVGS